MMRLELQLPTTFYAEPGPKERQARLQEARKLYGARVMPDYPMRLVQLMDQRRLSFTRRIPCLHWLAGQHRKQGRCDLFGLCDRADGRCINLREDERFDHMVFFHDEAGRRVVLTQPYYEWDFADLCAEFGLTCEKLGVSPYSPRTHAYLLRGAPGVDQKWLKARQHAALIAAGYVHAGHGHWWR